MTHPPTTQKDIFLLATNRISEERARIVGKSCLKDPKALKFLKSICEEWAIVLVPALPEFTTDELDQSEAEIRKAILEKEVKDDDFLEPPANDEPAIAQPSPVPVR